MESVAVETDLARRVYGTGWVADIGASGPVLRERLGKGRDPFHARETFDSVEDARKALGEDIVLERLPGRLRLPRLTPIPERPIFLLRLDDLTGRGVYVETDVIDTVEFSAWPSHMRGIVDAAACMLRLRTQTCLKIRVTHDRSGFPKLSGCTRERPLRDEPAIIPFRNARMAERAAEAIMARLHGPELASVPCIATRAPLEERQAQVGTTF